MSDTLKFDGVELGVEMVRAKLKEHDEPKEFRFGNVCIVRSTVFPKLLFNGSLVNGAHHTHGMWTNSALADMHAALGMYLDSPEDDVTKIQLSNGTFDMDEVIEKLREEGVKVEVPKPYERSGLFCNELSVCGVRPSGESSWQMTRQGVPMFTWYGNGLSVRLRDMADHIEAEEAKAAR